MQELAKKYLAVIDLEFVSVVLKEDKVISFIISMPLTCPPFISHKFLRLQIS